MVFIFLNCSKENNPITNYSNDDIIPLAVGNFWKYHYTLHDTVGNIYADFVTSSIIRGDTLIKNIRWYYIDKNDIYFSNLSDGYYIYDRYSPDSNKTSLVYKYPCNQNDAYSSWRVADRDTLITVPAGEFNCILYVYRLETREFFDYHDVFIKPGVGVIKTVRYGYVPNHPIFVWTISELTEYSFR